MGLAVEGTPLVVASFILKIVTRVVNSGDIVDLVVDDGGFVVAVVDVIDVVDDDVGVVIDVDVVIVDVVGGGVVVDVGVVDVVVLIGFTVVVVVSTGQSISSLPSKQSSSPSHLHSFCIQLLS